MSHYRDWYEHDEGKTYVLSRHLPPRFDISACAKFPLLRKSRLAHQVRQDVWRALQGVRGFSPVIRIDTFSDHMVLTAGGPWCAQYCAYATGLGNGSVGSGQTRKMDQMCNHPKPCGPRRLI